LIDLWARFPIRSRGRTCPESDFSCVDAGKFRNKQVGVVCAIVAGVEERCSLQCKLPKPICLLRAESV